MANEAPLSPTWEQGLEYAATLQMGCRGGGVGGGERKLRVQTETPPSRPSSPNPTAVSGGGGEASEAAKWWTPERRRKTLATIRNRIGQLTRTAMQSPLFGSGAGGGARAASPKGEATAATAIDGDMCRRVARLILTEVSGSRDATGWSVDQVVELLRDSTGAQLQDRIDQVVPQLFDADATV